jgi:ABC-type nitrate/sulfonate/bicarbonate transport system permease component
VTTTRTGAADDTAAFATPRPARRHGRGRARAGRRPGAFPPLRGLLPLALLLAVWEVRAPEGSPYFPPPSRWARALGDLGRNGALGPAAVATLVTFFVALAAATVLGALLGLVVGASRRADRALGPTLEFARAMPPAAVVPVATLLIGYQGTMKVAVVTFAALWPILLNTRAGVRSLDPVLLDTARCLHLSRFDSSRKCVLPALLPAIYLGVRVAAPVALVITLLVEILTRVNGVGGLIAVSQRNYQSAQVYGLILVAGLFSLLVNGLVAALEVYTFRHRPRG